MHTIITYGKAGCGKTTKLVEYVNYLHNNDLDFIVLAPTNAAIDNIINRIKNIEHRLFRTIHSFFRIDFTTDNMLGPIHTPSHVIIDEFSLINKQLFKRIYNLLLSSCLCEELRIYGDPLQLPPITSNKHISYVKLGNILNTLSNPSVEVIKHINNTIFNMKILNNAKFELLDVNRRSNETVKNILNIVLNNNTDKFNELVFVNNISYLLCNNYVYIAANYNQLQEIYDMFYKDVLFSIADLTIINQNIPKTVGYRRLYLYPGMTIFTTITDKNLGVYNGETLTIKTILPNVLECTKKDGETVYIEKVTYENEQYFPISPSFLLTVHKSQGKTINDVIVCVDNMFTISMLYTAMTRAANNLVFHTTTSDKNKAITQASKYKEFKQLYKLVRSYGIQS